MKTKNLLFLAMVAVAALDCNAQTSVPGGGVNGTWTLAGSPYNVQGSIQIVNGDSLIIQPGVTVSFQGTYKFLILGKLKAIGTITDTIIFTAANASTGWRGIRFDATPSTNDTSRIKYCKIQYGKTSNAYAPDMDGGGIWFNNVSKVVVSHSRIVNCNSVNQGGGISCSGYLGGSSPIIMNNIISNDTAWGLGGGIFCEGGSARIINNTISYNTATRGAGIHCEADTLYISNNIISHNTSGQMGGGICCWNGSYSTITKNTITYNFASDGGGIFSGNSNPITNNIISNNTANWGGGGGIEIEGGFGRQNISNNIITNNTSLGTGNGSGGGGIYCSGDSLVLTNNTIANNSAVNGGALYCYSSSPTFRNCIIRGNTDSISGPQVFLYNEPSDPSFYYCDIQGGSAAFELNGNFYNGTYQNNIDTNALFVSPSGGSGTGFNGVIADWSLQSSSSCIDKGDPNGTYSATDIASNPRVSGGRIDIGAYEFQVSLGIANNKNSSTINFYPNPSSGKFTFQSTAENISVIEIYNLLGENIYTLNVNKQTSMEIDLSSSPKGIYFVKIYTGEKSHTEKIVIQ